MKNPIVWVKKNLRRFTGFGFVGGFVFATGTGLLALLVEIIGLHPSLAYFLTAIYSIEINFLLNRTFVWKERPAGFWRHWKRFHVARLITFPLNQAVFNLMISSGFTWIVATLVGLAISTGINFLGLDLFVFKVPTLRGPDFPDQLTVEWKPKVSVVIPARNEGSNIRECIRALLAQTYPPHEIIVATEPGDTTVDAISDWIRSGVVIHTAFLRPSGIQAGERDTNARRFQGLTMATGNVLMLTDAKIRVPKDWIEKVVYLLSQGDRVVAGITTRMPEDSRFLAVLSDEGFFRENPRFSEPYLTLETYGKSSGLPVTANLAFLRGVLEAIQKIFPVCGFGGWEDYALISTILEAGFEIRTTNELVVYRTHKPSMRLAKHAVTGIAARQFYLKHRHNAFAKNRHRSVVLFTLTLCAGIGFLLGIGMVFGWVQAFYAGVALAGTVLILLGVYNVVLAGDLRAFAFPPIILLQLLVWTTGYWIATVLGGDVPTWLTEALKSLRTLLLAAQG